MASENCVRQSDQEDEVLQVTTTEARMLTEVELDRLQADSNMSAFKQQLLEKDAQKNWDLFYKRNTTAFYKDRHWTPREFPELYEGHKIILEAGCGVGNFLFPLLKENPDLFIYACDFSKRAVEFVMSNPLYTESRCKAFQCHLTSDDLAAHIPVNTVDYCSLIFVLSAIHPDKMIHTLNNIYKIMKPGGTLLIRDYGLYDHAQLRFKTDHKLSDNLYRRQDNTRAYYFSLEKLDEICAAASFTQSGRCYVHRRTVNKKEDIDVLRIFVQGRYIKTGSDTDERG